MENLPPIWILLRKGEDRNKCTVMPLRGIPGLTFIRYPLKQPLPVSNRPPLLLAPEAPPLQHNDTGRPLLFLDANWRWAPKMRNAVEPVEARSLPGWKTAYPRISKDFEDPAEGLATVEAMVAALAVLGFFAPHLLDHYPWRDEFLRLNGTRFQSIKSNTL